MLYNWKYNQLWDHLFLKETSIFGNHVNEIAILLLKFFGKIIRNSKMNIEWKKNIINNIRATNNKNGKNSRGIKNY